MKKCKKCGRCCDPIILSVKITPNLLADYAPEGWLQKHWHFLGKISDHEFHYSCDFYDKKTHLCKIHKTKPKICSEYPYVKEFPNDFQKFVKKGCVYKE